jgi:hypothetical protein
LRPHGAACARFVIDQDGLTQLGLQPIGQQTRVLI